MLNRSLPLYGAETLGLATAAFALPSLISAGGAAPVGMVAASALVGAWLHPRLRRTAGSSAPGSTAASTSMLRPLLIAAVLATGLAPLGAWGWPLAVVLASATALAPRSSRSRLALGAVSLGVGVMAAATLANPGVPFNPIEARYAADWLPLAIAAGLVAPAALPASADSRAPWRCAAAITAALPLLTLAFATLHEASPARAALVHGMFTASLAVAAGLTLLSRRDAPPLIAGAVWFVGPGAAAAAWMVPVFAPLLLAARVLRPQPGPLLLASGLTLLGLRAAPTLPAGVLAAGTIAFSLVAIAWWAALRAPHGDALAAS